MRLTTKSEYSLLALIYIARHQNTTHVHAEDICTQYGITKKYLEHLLTVLRQHGIIQTKRGAGGGYRLAKPATRITLAEIIRIMDGALAPTESVSRYFYTETPLSKERAVLSVFRDIRNYISRTLEHKTLADLV